MSKLKHSYYLVAGHLDEDYFEKVTVGLLLVVNSFTVKNN